MLSAVASAPHFGDRGKRKLKQKVAKTFFRNALMQNRDSFRTKAGRDALGWYHARIDEKRRYDLGPEHDWSSHAADAWGLVAVFRERMKNSFGRNGGPLKRNLKGVV